MQRDKGTKIQRGREKKGIKAYSESPVEVDENGVFWGKKCTKIIKK